MSGDNLLTVCLPDLYFRWWSTSDYFCCIPGDNWLTVYLCCNSGDGLFSDYFVIFQVITDSLFTCVVLQVMVQSMITSVTHCLPVLFYRWWGPLSDHFCYIPGDNWLTIYLYYIPGDNPVRAASHCATAAVCPAVPVLQRPTPHQRAVPHACLLLLQQPSEPGDSRAGPQLCPSG